VRQNRDGVQSLCSLLGRFSLIALISSFVATLYAKESFKDFKKSQIQSFQTYKDEKDTAFSKYLKDEWQSYISFEPIPLYEKQKPIEIDTARPKEEIPSGPKIAIKIKEKSLIKEEDLSKEENASKKEQEQVVIYIEEDKNSQKDISFDFFGTHLGFNIADSIKNANFYPNTQIGIANFFNSVAMSDYEPLVSEIDKIAKAMNLNDWGVYLLVRKISDKATTNQDNSKLLSWFLFNKLGYAVKAALTNKHIVLMHHSKKIIYAAPNYNFEDKKYYVVSDYAKEDVRRVYTYKQEYPNAIKPLDLSLERLPNFKENLQSKTLSFSHLGNSYDIPITYNKNIIDFMGSYPQAEYETFFNAPMEGKTYTDLAMSLKKYIEGKKASEAMNFVLHFVQKSFKYEQDNKQFGKEKVMFAQETLFYDKSDCEDRAILFSYLVKELFDVSVLGVKYKDHMATALYIPLEGDTVAVGSKKFVIADPTYIDASIGVSMPKYRSLQPQSYITVKK